MLQLRAIDRLRTLLAGPPALSGPTATEPPTLNAREVSDDEA